MSNKDQAAGTAGEWGRAGWSRRSLLLVAVVAALAVAGAIVALTRGGDESPAPATSATPPAGELGLRSDVPACSGGAEPAQAVVATLTTAATPEGAAETAAAVVRWTESTVFAQPGAVDMVRRVGNDFGSPELIALQQGQAPYLSRMTVSHPQPSRGAFRVMGDGTSATVTVLLPVRWSTGAAVHDDWRAVDVRLDRLADRWAVVSAASSELPDGVKPLQGAAVTDQDWSRYGSALSANGFRRYASGDC
ncbi:hypothetical protein GA0070616_0086 [Micromonospora nigra]|uniref:Uncharacterized protein n=1 Tax=Micromonospora nigra TaxID=145857 RepID=A0A1C6R7P1_9ACTN|nr:hypothetical protein [Micromonospora nigra]SCL12976.1 hypothetical protein GA0070616_0086 [Micromonospora nigra]